MSACRYRVVHVAIEPNVRGDEMRRVALKAVPSEPFGMEGDPPKPSPHPDGSISMLVTLEFAAKFSIGDEFTVTFIERRQD